MAAQLITLPYRPVINLLGGIEAGAELDVFLAGTTTRVSIFSDADLSVELENPLEADSAGRFPPVYFDDSVAIRFRLRANNNTVLADVDPYILDYADIEAAADAAALAAANALIAQTATETAKTETEALVDDAEAVLIAVQAMGGPLYASTALGLAATVDGDGFAVDNGDGTAGVYVNDAGTAVLTRTIIIDSTNAGTAALIGTTGGNLQAVLDAIGGAATIDLTTDVTGVLPVANGGTNASTASAARTSLGAAASGANTDITALDQDVTITATGTIAANSLGFRGIPQNSQGGAYALVLGDAGRHISITTGGVTIPANASVAFPVGTAIVLYNNSSSSQNIAITSDTLRLSGTATTGTRALLQRGVATILKVASTEWVISGNIT